MDKLARWAAALMLTVGAVPLTGCRICADCEDLAYPAYGGAWQRTRRDSGRVGSVFDPAGAQAVTLVDRDQPPTPDALERQRQEARENGIEAPDRGDASEPRNGDRESPSDVDPGRDLRERTLDDIQEEKEKELREKQLDEINIHWIPQSPIPATVR